MNVSLFITKHQIDMKKYYYFLITCFLCLAPIRGMAETLDTITIGKIKYVPNGENTVKLVQVLSSAHNGSITIPSSITHKEKSYTVTAVGKQVCRAHGYTDPDSASRYYSLHYYDADWSWGHWRVLQYDCDTTVRSITLPNTVSVIEDSAFVTLENLEHIVLPKELKHLGASAFSACHNLKNIDLPVSLKQIEKSTFYGCGLSEIRLPDGIEIIREHAFAGCDKLHKVHLPDKLTTIEDFVFYGCKSLQAIIIPPNVMYMGSEMFNTKMKYVKFEGKVPPSFSQGTFLSTGDMAAVVYYLPTIYVPLESYDIYEEHFRQASLMGYGVVGLVEILPWYNATFEQNGIVYGVCGSDKAIVIQPQFDYQSWNVPHKYEGEIVIPSKVTYNEKQYYIDSIGYKAFGNQGFEKGTIQKVTIEEGVKAISHDAFYRCESLETAILPQSLRSIGEEAFYRCSHLETIVLPDSITEIGYGTFSNCSNLKSIHLPEALRIIGPSAFSNCSELRITELPDQVGEIGEKAFHSCRQLSLSKFPEQLWSIGDAAFYSANIKTEVFPKRVVRIGKQAFKACKCDAPIKELPQSLEIVGDEAFYRCDSLSISELPASLKLIGTEAFYNCKNVSISKLPESIRSIGDKSFYGCTRIADLSELPYNLGQIGVMVFGETSIKKTLIHRNKYLILYANENDNRIYKIPYGITTIWEGAFFNQHPLYAIYVTSSVTKIHDPYFVPQINRGSDYAIYFNAQTPPELVYPQNGLKYNGKIYVPYGCSINYRTSEWHWYWPSRDFYEWESEEGTAVASPQMSLNANNPFYDLSGRRTNKPTRGLYIQGNRKVFIP